MSQNDYIILRDEDGKAYIAHAGLLDNARSAIRGATNSISTTAQQVANKAKGVGREVRQNHKYILKVNENGRTRYFYKPEEVKAYYEAKRKGIKNPAEYAQKAADAASNAVDAVKNTLREASGYAAKDRMGAAAAKRAELNAIQNQKHETWTQAKKAKDQADVKTFQATIESEMANEKAKKSNVFNRKQRETDAKTASDQQKQYAAKSREADANEQKARRELDKAIDAYNKNAGEEYDNQRIYENSLAGRVDRTTAAASSAFNKAKNTANNAVSNAKNAYERMRGEFRDKVNEVKNDIRESTGQAARDRMDAAAEKYPELENDRRKKEQEYEAAKYQADRASNKLADAYADARVAEGRADRSNIFNRKQRNNEAENARKVEAEARRAFDEAVEREGDAMTRSINANQKYANADLDYQAAKKVYENSLAGRVDRSAANAREAASSAYNKAKDSANNTVTNAKTNYDRMKSELRDKAEQAGNAAKSAANKVADKARDIAGYDERDRRDAASDYAWDLASKGKLSNEALDQQRETEKQYRKTPLGMIDTARDKIGLTARKAMKDLEAERDGANASNDPSGVRKFNADSMARSAKAMYQETPLGKLESFAANPHATVKDSINGMIDNARSSTAKAVNEAWDKIPKNSDGTVNPFDKNFQSTYNDWKAKKDKYDSSLAGRAKDAAEKATDAVQDMIDQAKKAVKGNSTSNLTREQEKTNTGSRQTKRTQEEMNEMRNKKSDFEQGYDDFIKTMGEYGKIRDRIARHGLLSDEESRFNDRLYQIEQDVLAGKLTPNEAVRKAEQMEEEAKTLKKVQLHR